MWVKFKVTYSGAMGFFIADSKYDLPESQLKKIDPRSYEQTVAPWEEKIDKNLVAKIAQNQKLKAARNDVNALELEISSLKGKCDQMLLAKKELAAAQTLVKKIEKEIDDERKIEEARKAEAARQAAEADAANKGADDDSKGQDDSAGTGQSDPEVGKKKSVKPAAKKNKKK